MRVFLVKREDTIEGSLEGGDFIDKEQIKSLKNNVYYKCDIRKVRNPKHHRLIFGLVHYALQNINEFEYPTWNRLYLIDPNNAVYLFIKASMKDAGIIDIQYNLDGSPYMVPKHINFEDMDEDEFAPVSDVIFTSCSTVTHIPVDTLHEKYEEILCSTKTASGR